MLLSLVYCRLLDKYVVLLVCPRIDIHEPEFCRRFDSRQALEMSCDGFLDRILSTIEAPRAILAEQVTVLRGARSLSTGGRASKDKPVKHSLTRLSANHYTTLPIHNARHGAHKDEWQGAHRLCRRGSHQ